MATAQPLPYAPWSSVTALPAAQTLPFTTAAPQQVLPFAAAPVALGSTSSLPGRPASPRAISSPLRTTSPPGALRELSPVSTEAVVNSATWVYNQLQTQPQAVLHPFPQRFDAGPVAAVVLPDSRAVTSERRMAEPFFYPTTVSPLTTAFGSSEQIIPLSAREVPVQRVQQNVEQQPEAKCDLLSKQVQALEHAKSLAAVQSAQAMQKIRGRQEQLRKEAQQAMQSLKDMQAEFSLASFAPFGSPAPTTPAAQPEGGPQGTPDQPMCSQEAWRNCATQSPPSPSSTSETVRGVPSQMQPQLLPAGVEALFAHERSIPPHRGLGAELAGASTVEGTGKSLATTLPGFDLPSNDISAMASHILTSHNTPAALASGPGPLGGSAIQPQAPLAPRPVQPQAPYVDAMGNPLEFNGRELPNIKDDMPARLPELRGFGGPMGFFQQAQASSSEQLLKALEPPAQEDAPDSGRELAVAQSELVPLQSTATATATGVVHERAPLHVANRQPTPPFSRQPSAEADAVASGLNASDVFETAMAEGAAAMAATMKQSSELAKALAETSKHQQMGAADAAAGSAVTPPPPLPAAAPKAETQLSTRNRAAPKESAAAKRAAAAATRRDSPRREAPRRTPAASPPRSPAASPPRSPAASLRRDSPRRPRGSEETPAKEAFGGEKTSRTEPGSARDNQPVPKQALKNLPPKASEELRAELEECLDMIRWCSESLTRESLQDLKDTTRPASVVKDVVETVALLLGQPEERWDRLKRLIGTPTFLERVQRLNFQQSITRETFRKLCDRLQQLDFDEEQIKSVCVPVVPLAMWCRAIGVYLSKTKFRGGPEIRPVAGAGAALPVQAVEKHIERPATSEAYMVFDPDLRTLGQEELRSVENLTISRPDVGAICFHGSTDCSKLDFECIVRLEIGEVLVYPDSSLKPPVGMDLNKPATVTMYQCWPPNGSKLLQDQKAKDRYKEKIQTMTEDKHAKFLDYDCNTGIWKFGVEHF